MSHQSGIKCDPTLLDKFKTASSNVRALKIGIQEEQAIWMETLEKSGDWMSDWDRYYP